MVHFESWRSLAGNAARFPEHHARVRAEEILCAPRPAALPRPPAPPDRAGRGLLRAAVCARASVSNTLDECVCPVRSDAVLACLVLPHLPGACTTSRRRPTSTTSRASGTSPSSARPRASPSRHAPCPPPNFPPVQTGRTSSPPPPPPRYKPDAHLSPLAYKSDTSLSPLRTKRACMSPPQAGGARPGRAPRIARYPESFRGREGVEGGGYVST
jgi:hypothetical protein